MFGAIFTGINFNFPPLVPCWSVHLVISVTLLGQTTLGKIIDSRLQINVHVRVFKTIEYRPQMNQHILLFHYNVPILYPRNSLILQKEVIFCKNGDCGSIFYQLPLKQY